MPNIPFLYFNEDLIKGQTTLVNLDITQLVSLPELNSDPWFSDFENIQRVILSFKSSSGNQKKKIIFNLDINNESSISFTSRSRDEFILSKITLIDYEKDKISFIPTSFDTSVTISSTPPPSNDSDEDGLTDEQEIIDIGTDPFDPDTDGDTLTDGIEVNVTQTNPLNADIDEDLLTDYVELFESNTDPNTADTDNDNLTDGEEFLNYSTNPNNPDTDNDTYTDGVEISSGTNPLDNNSYPGSNSNIITEIRALYTENTGIYFSSNSPSVVPFPTGIPVRFQMFSYVNSNGSPLNESDVLITNLINLEVEFIGNYNSIYLGTNPTWIIMLGNTAGPASATVTLNRENQDPLVLVIDFNLY